VLSTGALAWPWHRVAVTATSGPVVAEFARAVAVGIPCAAVAFAGVRVIAAGTLQLSPGSVCPQALVALTPDSARRLDSLLADAVVTGAADSLQISGPTTGVFRALRSVVLMPGADVEGVIVAPSVAVRGGSRVRGTILAADTVLVEPGAVVVGDEARARAALIGQARLRLVGRRGLLLPPPAP
jgi:hypothetical protein